MQETEMGANAIAAGAMPSTAQPRGFAETADSKGIGVDGVLASNVVSAVPVLPDGNLYLGASHGREPIQFQCSQCHNVGTTITRKKRGFATWTAVVASFGLCFFCLFDSCSFLDDVYHECPNCHTQVGISSVM